VGQRVAHGGEHNGDEAQRRQESGQGHHDEIGHDADD
jgi:hypothetical protein